MTDMHLIAPLLEDHTSQGAASDNGVEQKPDDHDHDHDQDRGVLPNELRENFEEMKAIWRQARRATGEEAEELKHKEREISVKTAVAVDTEVSRWQHGIAELETLLAQEETEEHELEEVVPNEPAWRMQREHFVQFPTLPPVIPPEDDESSKDGSTEDNSDSETAAITSP